MDAFETDGRIIAGDVTAVDDVEVTVAGEMRVLDVEIGVDIGGNKGIGYIEAGLAVFKSQDKLRP